jgi:hypothetical protein
MKVKKEGKEKKRQCKKMIIIKIKLKTIQEEEECSE